MASDCRQCARLRIFRTVQPQLCTLCNRIFSWNSSDIIRVVVSEITDSSDDEPKESLPATNQLDVKLPNENILIGELDTKHSDEQSKEFARQMRMERPLNSR